MENFWEQPKEIKPEKEPQILYDGEKEPAKDELPKISLTALMTARGLNELPDMPCAKEIYTGLCQMLGLYGEKEPQKIDALYPLYARHRNSEEILRKAIEEEGIVQVIEIGAGFAAHSLTLSKYLKKYVEIDLPANSKIKRAIVDEFIGDMPIEFVAGDIFDEKTWDNLEEQLVEGPVAIFCEGLIMYLPREQQTQFLSRVEKILRKKGGFFMHEDPDKYHQEIESDKGSDNRRFSELKSKLINVSGSEALKESYAQEEITDFYKRLGFDVERRPEVAKDDRSRIDRYPQDGKAGAMADLEAMEKADYRTWILRLRK